MILNRDAMVKAISDNPRLGKATKASIYLALQLMPAPAIAELGEFIEKAAARLLAGDGAGFLDELGAAGVDPGIVEEIRKSAEAARRSAASAEGES